MDAEMIPLIHLPICTPAEVVALPKIHGLARRLIALGLTTGSRVEVLSNWGSGPVIIEVHGARLALGRGQAARVMVRPRADEPSSEGECAASSLPVTASPEGS
jgi:ferrous iron transport protein A